MCNGNIGAGLRGHNLKALLFKQKFVYFFLVGLSVASVINGELIILV